MVGSRNVEHRPAPLHVMLRTRLPMRMHSCMRSKCTIDPLLKPSDKERVPGPWFRTPGRRTARAAPRGLDPVHPLVFRPWASLWAGHEADFFVPVSTFCGSTPHGNYAAYPTAQRQSPVAGPWPPLDEHLAPHTSSACGNRPRGMVPAFARFVRWSMGFTTSYCRRTVVPSSRRYAPQFGRCWPT